MASPMLKQLEFYMAVFDDDEIIVSANGVDRAIIEIQRRITVPGCYLVSCGEIEAAETLNIYRLAEDHALGDTKVEHAGVAEIIRISVEKKVIH